MDTQKKLELITKGTEEVLTREDLEGYIETGVPLKHYIGFEISGQVHLGSGPASMQKVKDFLDAGAKCSIFLADWHTWINDKLGGDKETIGKVAAGYFKEAMKASLKCVKGDSEKIKFVLGSELYHNNDQYWETFVDVCKNTSLARMQRSTTIMGKKEGEKIDFAKLLYPGMQVADVFAQEVSLAHAGLDQRKAHVIARDVALKLKLHPLKGKKGEKIKPVAVHHALLLGLQKPPAWPVPKEKMRELWSEMKMSKSVPNSCVFVHDSEQEIRKKIGLAFCPEGETAFNPVLDWARHLLFWGGGHGLAVEREKRFGGNTEYESFGEAESAFRKKELHPMDLKNAVAERLAKFLEPARKHFEKPRNKKMKEELERLGVTR